MYCYAVPGEPTQDRETRVIVAPGLFLSSRRKWSHLAYVPGTEPSRPDRRQFPDLEGARSVERAQRVAARTSAEKPTHLEEVSDACCRFGALTDGRISALHSYERALQFNCGSIFFFVVLTIRLVNPPPSYQVGRQGNSLISE